MLLGLNEKDVGSASALINFLNNGFGVVGMGLIVLPFPDYIVGIGIILFISMAMGLPLWWLASRMSR